MKTILALKIQSLILSMLFILLLLSCSSHEDEVPTNNPPNTTEKSVRAYSHTLAGSSIKMTQEAIFVKSDLNDKLISVNSSQIKFNYIPQFDTIKNGDILYSLPTGDYKEGYAVKLSNKNINGGVVSYSVTAPKVEEIFKEFHSNNTYLPNFDNQDFKVFVPNTSNIQMRTVGQVPGFQLLDPLRIKSKSITGNTLTLEYIFWDYDNNYSTTWDQVTAKMVVKADGNVVQADFSKLLSINPQFSISGKPRISLEVTLEYNFDANIDKTLAENCKDAYNLEITNRRIPLAQISMTGNSPTDILIKPTLVSYIKIGLSASTKFKFTTKYENFGANYALSSLNVLSAGSWTKNIQLVAGTPSYDFNTNVKAHFDLGIGVGMEDQILPNLNVIFGEDTKATIGEYFEINGALDMNFVAGSNNNGLYCNTFSVVPSFMVDAYSEGKISLFGNTVLDLPKQSIWSSQLLQGLQSINLNLCSTSPTLTDNFGNNYATVSLNNKWWSAENWKGVVNGANTFNATYGDFYLRTNSDYQVYSNTGTYTTNLNIPTGWRVPTAADYQALINSLGSLAYNILAQSSSIGFNAKPYGYINVHSVWGNSSVNRYDVNTKAVFLTSDTVGTNVKCLVVDFQNHIAEIQEVHSNNYPYYGDYNYFNLRLIKD